MKKGQLPSLPEPKTPTQKLFLKYLLSHQMIVATGSAGTGKTFLATCVAALLLKQKRINKIVITRPNIPTGKSIGFFPGSLSEKMEPWTIPVTETIKDFLGKGDYDCQVKNGNIETVPLETIRGRTFNDCFVILDEAQNCSVEELKAFLTRIGENTKMVIVGDTTQSDLSKSGLSVIVKMIAENTALYEAVPVVQFNPSDIVRSGLCRLWVEAFEQV